MKLLPKHRFITKAAKIDPQASDSPREAQGGGRGLACQAMPPRLSREVGPRIPGATCPATGTRQCPSLIKPPRASTPALCAPRGPSTKRALQGGGRVGCVRLSSPASLGSNLAASSFLMARGAECKRRWSGGSHRRARGQGPPTPRQRQNSRAFFLRSFLFQRARRSNSSTLIPNTSRNSSGDRCLSSLVRSTSLGSFTRIRFVTISASYG